MVGPDDMTLYRQVEPAVDEEGARYLSFDRVAHEYDETRYLPPAVQEQAARLLREVAALAPGQALLDAGVGTGRFALPLARLGVPVVGVDISLKMMRRLEAKRAGEERAGTPLPLRLVQGDLRRLPFASGAFGAVLIVHILHLIVDWREVLAEIRRVLAPGGVLLLGQEGSGRRALPVRDKYFELARQRNILPAHRGAQNIEEVWEFLRAQGAQVERAGAGPVRWMARLRVADTLDRLRRRTWSTLWSLPDADHAEMMAETEAWARQMYGSLETAEELEAKFGVWTVRWPHG
ncbi:MAG TPA: class I SAM-dependent methyltransferase [Chthonomonadaceae bacterium]|nr:class I SAM-dependent methyltransferase [Chthonomonadaceae bacterium]